MAISPAPKKKSEAAVQDITVKKSPEEKMIDEFISRGGSTAKALRSEQEDKLKGINIKLLSKEIEDIRTLREKRPNNSRSKAKRLAISLHDWIIEAVQEKIEREKKKFNIAP